MSEKILNTIGKEIILCADDFGIAPGVNRGICELLEMQRINATSVMSLSEYWSSDAADLKAVATNASVGLHLTLTDFKPLSDMPQFAPEQQLPSIGQLLRMAYRYQLPAAEITTEIIKQIEAFVDIYGRLPDDVDGHQHVHVLPGIRHILWQTIESTWPKLHQVWVRSCSDRKRNILRRGVSSLKALFIHQISKRWHRQINQTLIRTNQGFAGIYNFDLRKVNYSQLFTKFLHRSGKDSLIMCHPGHVDEVLCERDSVTASREHELHFFKSDAYLVALKEAGVKLASLR